MLEDNEAVIKMIVKGRSPTMRHVSRTHRVALDWLFDRTNLDLKIQIKYIDTKHQLADILTKGNFTRDEWNHLLCLFNTSHFSSTVCSDTVAKRSQQDSGGKRVTAQSRPMMNLVARARSNVSSSTSVSPVKRSYGSQHLWSSVAKKEERSERPDIGIDQLQASDHYYHEQFMESLSPQQATQSGMMTVLGLLKSGKQILRCTSDRSDPMKLLGERHDKFDLVSLTRKLFTTEPRNSLRTRKCLVTDRGDPISILKKRHGLNNSPLETRKQNWNCQ